MTEIDKERGKAQIEEQQRSRKEKKGIILRGKAYQRKEREKKRNVIRGLLDTC